MAKYLKLFETVAEYESVKDTLLKPNVSYCQDQDIVMFNKGQDNPYATQYFTLTTANSQDSATFTLHNVNSMDLSYSVDEGTTWTEVSDSQEVEITPEQKLMLKGYMKGSSGGSGSGSGSGSGDKKVFSTNSYYSAEGNIMSLVRGDDFVGVTDLTDVQGNAVVFKEHLFASTGIVNAGNLVLPATTLASSCYYCMFASCSSLTTAPELPATTLANDCYYEMFQGCTSLTTAPELPATTLAIQCYQYMFNGCTLLTTAPALPATTLTNGCYQDMFNGCTSLTTAPALHATTLEGSCYSGMFAGCTGLTTAPDLPATTLEGSCYSGMFAGCTGLTTAPDLPATTLADGCYYYMFKSCTSLTTAPELPATTLTYECYEGMFRGCTSLNYIKCLATNVDAIDCTTDWVNGVAASGTFVKADNMNNWEYGTNGIPFGWAKMNNSELPIAWDYTSSYAINSPIKPKLMHPNLLPVTYSSSDTSTATIDNSGNVTFVSEGIVTLTAVFDGNETYQAKTTTCQIQITAYDYACDYLTIVSSADNNTIGWRASDVSVLKTISVSTDDGQTWTTKESSDSTSGTTLATLNNGDKLLIKGSNTGYGSDGYNNYFTSTQNFDVEGNIMSLLYGDNFIGETSLSGKTYAFDNLFGGNTYLVNAQNLKLPATTLADCCYKGMFVYCTSLTTLPELPATTLANECYSAMFEDCSSLTTAPELPATTLASNCYEQMFWGCISLTTAPALPATTLAPVCYLTMFNGCTSLTTAPALPATTLTNSCYSNMFGGCTSLTTAPELPATTLASFCYDGMFINCTSLTTAPALPATTLADNCYTSMFQGCTSLTTAPATLPATTLADYCYCTMFSGCTALTTAPELPATTLATSCYQYMFSSCTSLNYIKCLATDISAGFCTSNWVNGVAATGIFVKDSNMTSWTTGNDGIPTGWTVEDAS